VHFFKVIGPEEFKLESKKAPKDHKPDLKEVKDKSLKRCRMNDMVVDSNKRHKRHVPEEVLSGHDFVKGNECPGLDRDCKENIVKH